MSSSLPVREDRIIHELPLYFTRDAAVHTNADFHVSVQNTCQKSDFLRFTVAKVIVVGDVSVGKTSLINRFCRNTYAKSYRPTIGVDFEMERFEILGVPFSLQLWDTAGQERFKCVASTYYRGAQAIIVVFDLCNYNSLDNARQWLEDAMIDNDPSSVLLFLVGTKKDLSGSDILDKVEQEAIKLSEEINAEYWAVSALSGESVRDFFIRVASLTFEACVLTQLERDNNKQEDDIIKITDLDNDQKSKKQQANCCD